MLPRQLGVEHLPLWWFNIRIGTEFAVYIEVPDDVVIVNAQPLLDRLHQIRRVFNGLFCDIQLPLGVFLAAHLDADAVLIGAPAKEAAAIFCIGAALVEKAVTSHRPGDVSFSDRLDDVGVVDKVMGGGTSVPALKIGAVVDSRRRRADPVNHDIFDLTAGRFVMVVLCQHLGDL